MGVNVDIAGLENLCDSLDKVANGSSDKMLKTVKRLCIEIADDAKDLCVVGETGILRESITTRTMQTETEIIGEVFTNTEYAAYVEFGTGRVGAAAGLVREGIDLHYTMQPWMIPAKAMSAEQAKAYGFEPIIENGIVKGYLCFGAKPHPFLYPAMKNNEDNIINTVGKAAIMEIK